MRDRGIFLGGGPLKGKSFGNVNSSRADQRGMAFFPSNPMAMFGVWVKDGCFPSVTISPLTTDCLPASGGSGQDQPQSPERSFCFHMNVILTYYFWAKNKNPTWMPFHLQLGRQFPGNNRLSSKCILIAQGPIPKPGFVKTENRGGFQLWNFKPSYSI